MITNRDVLWISEVLGVYHLYITCISPVYHLYIQIHKKQDSGGQLRRLKRLTCEAPVAGAFVMGHPLDSKGFHEIQWDFWRFISPRMVFIYVYIYIAIDP